MDHCRKIKEKGDRRFLLKKSSGGGDPWMFKDQIEHKHTHLPPQAADPVRYRIGFGITFLEVRAMLRPRAVKVNGFPSTSEESPKESTQKQNETGNASGLS